MGHSFFHPRPTLFAEVLSRRSHATYPSWRATPLRGFRFGFAFLSAGFLFWSAAAAIAQSFQFQFDPCGNLQEQTTEVQGSPQIIGQPQLQIVIPGQAASFSVVVADTTGVSYQWFFNNAVISGATAASLLLTNVSSSNEGLYSVKVSNVSGSISSSTASLYIDSNGNGLPDSWELAYFGNLNQTATGDPDGDGVSNLQEFLDGTNPTNAASALYRITLFNDGGTVTVVPDLPAYAIGQVVTLTAMGSDAFPFHAWTGDVTSRSNSIAVTMSTNLTLFARFLPFTLTWTNTVPGNWNVAANWTPNLAPSTNENVVMVYPVTVALNSDVQLLGFTLGALNSGPELTGTGRLTISGTGTWSAGTMSGTGATIIAPGAAFTITDPVAAVSLNNRTLENGGMVLWSSGGIIGINNGVITNDVGAVFEVLRPGSFNYGGGLPRFDNAGTFLTQSNTATVFESTAFNNYGTINLASGSLLSLGGGGVQVGTVTVPTGATINYAGGTFTSSASLSITGAGTLQVGGGTANLAGTIQVTGTNAFTGGTANLTGNYTCVSNTLLNIVGGTANFDGSGTVAPQVLNLNGTLGGANTVTVGSALNWTGGTMDGNGETIIQPGATLTVAAFTGYGGVSQVARTLENSGMVVWGGGNWSMNSCVITNGVGAIFQIQGSAAFNYGGGSPRFDNAGTFLPAPAGTSSFYGIAFNNYGAINLGGGSLLSLGGGGVQVGTVTVPAGATLNYSSGTFNASGSSSITGAGTLQVSGGTANLGGTVNVTGTNSFTGGTANLTGNYTCVNNTLLNIVGGSANFDGSGTVAPKIVNLNGTLGGANIVTVGSAMNWTGGTMDGSGETIIQPGATLTIPAFTGYGGVYLTTRTLANSGMVVWGGGNWNMNSCAITNDVGATFQIQGLAAFNYGGGSPRFDNAGTFSPPPAGTNYFYGIAFNNYGAINLAGGSLLSLGGGGVQVGTVTVPAGATLSYAGGTFNAGASSSITGAGTLLVSGGTADLAGTVNVTGTNSFTGGTANLMGNYTCVSNTLLNIAGGTANFDGTGTVAPQVLDLNGTLGGAETVTIGSKMNWSGGTMNGSGQTIVKPGATLTVASFTGYGGVLQDTRTLENSGAVVWGGGNWSMNSCIITNDVGASFQIQGSAAFNYGGGSPRFDNAGTFLPTPTGNTAFNGIPFNNYGAVNLSGGIFELNGAYSCNSNSALNYFIEGKTPGANYGQLQASGSINLNGSLSVTLTNHFIPGTNDSFNLLSAVTRNGAFAKFNYPSNTVSLLLSNTTTSVIVRVTGVSLQPTNALSAPPGIISWWRAENDAKDAVGPNDGYLTNGATYAAGEVGQSFRLDGIGGYVVIPDSPSLRPASVTMEAWVQIFSTNGTQLVFAKPLGSGALDSYGLALVNGAPLAAICDTNGFGTFISSTNPLALGQWYHLAYTYDGTSSQEMLFVNGVAAASANAAKSMSFDAHPLLLGADIENEVPAYFLNGQIDEASLYNRALTAGEIASIYNVGSLGKQIVSVSQPVLHLDFIAPTKARFYWSTNYPNYQLQYNTRLDNTNWAASGLTPEVTGADFVVTNILVGPQTYYRLSVLSSP